MQDQNSTIEKTLNNLKLKALNEMQTAAYDAIKAPGDVILLSATGSGKTLAFLLPIVETLDERKTTQALIVVPSRELAQQIEQVFRSMGTGYKITACYGGHLRETEENNLTEPPAIIVGTPGRLCDHIRRQNITTDTITTLVLDEYDKTLELGFAEEMEFIVASLPTLNKRVLTSATRAVDLQDFIGLQEEAQTLDFLPLTPVPAEKLAIKTVQSPEKDKADTLFTLLCYLGNRPSIIFCNHRDAVERTSKLLAEKGILNTFYHGGMEQQQRDSALSKFRNGTVNFLVTTDLAARGLDIPNIRYIIHYHLPETPESYTHRNGRTARMDATGTAIVILSPDEVLPSYITEEVEGIELNEQYPLPEQTQWITLFIAAGKKDKVNKIDIVGFLSHKGQLKKEDIGLIDVKDFFSFVAIRRSKATNALHVIKNEKIKNKKVTIAVAR
jgi:ATP-independent RNA helicase DbpA